MKANRLTAEELSNLVKRVFEPRPEDKALAVIVDLPDDEVPDTERWRERRALAAGWVRELLSARPDHGLEISLFLYRNVHSNNADLPLSAWRWTEDTIPDHIAGMAGQLEEPMEQVLTKHRLVIAPTQFSTTAPLKMMAPRLGFRGATMPGFSSAMVPALRLDYAEINRRVWLLKELLDDCVGADFHFVVDGSSEYRLHLDLRHRKAHASGGLLLEPGTAGNLPSGETYIVPYEGEIDGDPTASRGQMPVQFGDEVVIFEIEENRARRISSIGPESEAEAARLASEPARGNIAELGLGVLADFGIKPIGEVLLDEKLGLHLAFGRSEHFGGQVGPEDFSRPEAVMHQDHVYLPELQPKVSAVRVVLERRGGASLDLIRDGGYVIDFGG
jgi:leucyl aminopeptidase (aminopeptidase T)